MKSPELLCAGLAFLVLPATTAGCLVSLYVLEPPASRWGAIGVWEYVQVYLNSVLVEFSLAGIIAPLLPACGRRFAPPWEALSASFVLHAFVWVAFGIHLAAKTFGEDPALGQLDFLLFVA
eukprot:CAMPEP_0198597468 /NCGR_PEP_ID=MMETSP1462-20131121/144453_1 /TAXON_ID=1333877 /ORGANISM="Brandtodinium nutriculum, Strain RCC3387" /LENGTH=120 /DNA_ID=CAMNT_0044329129 /DNA_START=56 /DNA_END=415 /DNA_ORIENTATION=-